MSKFLDYISSTKTIITSLILMLIIGAGFSLLPQYVGGEMLDMQMNAADASSRVAEMSPRHKANHIWITLILDSLYPLTYGAFLAGIAARFVKPWRKYAIVPALVSVIADFGENAVQVFALLGHENILALKNIITPLKFSSFILATLLAALLLIIAFARWARRKWK